MFGDLCSGCRYLEDPYDLCHRLIANTKRGISIPVPRFCQNFCVKHGAERPEIRRVFNLVFRVISAADRAEPRHQLIAALQATACVGIRPGARTSSPGTRPATGSPRPAPRAHSSLSATCVATRLSASCSGRLAPMITLVTCGWCNSQASATWATDTPCACAIGRMASMQS